MTRTPLPHRRPSLTRDLTFRGQPLTVTVGFDPEGRAKEVFAVGPKEGSDMAHTIADACVVISIALQHGIAPAELAKSLGSVPSRGAGEERAAPASVIGAVLGCLMEVAG